MNWELLENQDIDELTVWQKINAQFGYTFMIPETQKKLHTDLPNMTFDITPLLNTHAQSTDDIHDILLPIAQTVFKQIIQNDEWMYALDWQHDCYTFYPAHKEPWQISLFPDGDYHLFVARDFQNGWLGDPRELTITIVGREFMRMQNKLIPAFQAIGCKIV